jgi:hypothetical protein
MTVQIEDRLAVEDLLARYCWFVDENRGKEWAALFVEDGILEGVSPQPIAGRAALEGFPGQVHAGNGGSIRHQFGNLYIDPGPGQQTLTAHFYNQITFWDGDGTRLRSLALSTATIVRAGANGPWRIARNSVRLVK